MLIFDTKVFSFFCIGIILDPTEKTTVNRVIMIVPRIFGWNSGAKMRLILIYNAQINGKNAPGKNQESWSRLETQLDPNIIDMQLIIVKE